MKAILLQLFFVSFFVLEIYAQWTNDPSVNSVICDTSGESTLAKIVSTSDGGNFVSWFDNRAGSYAVYLQKLNALGEKQWNSNGLLISNNPQNSSLVDYDLTRDPQNNAIIAFTDVRNGNLNVYIYKISPTGEFLWGNNGVALSASTDYQPNPKITVTNDGNVVVAWIIAVNPYKIALQKLSPSGVKLWGDVPLIYQSTSNEGYSYPKPIASDSGSVIVVHTVTTGSFPAQTVKIAAQKISSTGVPQWGTGGVWIQNLGKVQVFSAPFSAMDNNNGAFISWYDDRDNNSLQSSFVQRINSSGVIQYPANGSELCLTANEHKFYPVVSNLIFWNEVYVFWIQKNSLQSQASIVGQKISSSGDRLWTDNGAVLLSFTSNSISGLTSAAIDSSIYLFYNEGNTSGVQNKIMAMSVSRDGNNRWGTPITLSNPTQEKLHTVSTVDIHRVGKVFWTDRRSDGGGIYAQNVNPNGALGNLIVPVELASFTASRSNKIVTLNWTTSSEKNNLGFEILRRVHNKGFEKIGFVKGSGTITEQQNYSFIDNLNLALTLYLPPEYAHWWEVNPNLNLPLQYKLKQIDFDGTENFSHVVVVELDEVTQPEQFILQQNYPNPFNPSTKIKFTIPALTPSLSRGERVILKVYDILGREVATLVNEELTAGDYEVEFDGSSLQAGIYFYRLQSSVFSDMKKFVLLK